MRFIGIDLAWSDANPSAGLAIEGDSDRGRVLGWDSSLGGDDWIEAFVTHWAGDAAIVAVDAPLVVPNEAGARPVDLELSHAFRRFEAGAYPVNRSRPGGGLRGERIGRLLQAKGYRLDPRIAARDESRRLIEVFPHAALVSLLALDRTLKYKARPRRAYRERWVAFTRYHAGLRSLREPRVEWPPELVGRDVVGVRGRALKAHEDALDAATCAYVACYCWYWGPAQYTIFGDPRSAHVVVPMTAWMRGRLRPESGRDASIGGWS